MTGGGDHGRIVGGEGDARVEHGQFALLTERAEAGTERRVGGDPAGQQDRPHFKHVKRAVHRAAQRPHHRRLEAGRQVAEIGSAGGILAAGQRRDSFPLDEPQDLGLEARKTEVEFGAVRKVRERQQVAVRVAALRQPVQHRAARIAEAEPFGDLVVCLAGRIVAGLAQQPVGTLAFEQEETRVPPGDHQRQRRVGDVAAFQIAGPDVPLDVIHAHQRNAAGEREGLGERDPGKQRSNESRAVGYRNRLDVREPHAGLAQRLPHHR